MKNINKDILKQLENDNFSKEIIEDPLRLAYYTALKGYKSYLSTSDLDGTPQSTTKFKKYNKELLKIMKTEAHVCHLLVEEYGTDKKFYHTVEYDNYYTSGRYGRFISKATVTYRKWNYENNYYFDEFSKQNMYDYLYSKIKTLFPSLIFVNYKTSNLKEILNLLHMRLKPYTHDLDEEYQKKNA